MAKKNRKARTKTRTRAKANARNASKKGNFIAENYSKSWAFLKESKKSIYIIALTFLFFTLAGFFLPTPSSIADQIMKLLEDILAQTRGLSQFGLIKFIFFNNLQSSFFGLVLGIFLGVFPVLFAALNGYILGFVASMSVNEGGVGVLWKVFPHGIFELPAVFISLGLGLRTGMFILKSNKRPIKDFFYEVMRVFVFVVVPLLIVAAVIEGSLIALLR